MTFLVDVVIVLALINTLFLMVRLHLRLGLGLALESVGKTNKKVLAFDNITEYYQLQIR